MRDEFKTILEEIKFGVRFSSPKVEDRTVHGISRFLEDHGKILHKLLKSRYQLESIEETIFTKVKNLRK